MNTVGQNPFHVNHAPEGAPDVHDRVRGVRVETRRPQGAASYHVGIHANAIAGELVTDAKRPRTPLADVLALVLALVLAPACVPTIDDDDSSSSSSSSSSDDGGEWCVCDAFGPPGVFDPSTCEDGSACCDYDDDGIADAEPTRLVCFGGGR